MLQILQAAEKKAAQKKKKKKTRPRAWWKRFILGPDLITCIQSSLQCPQPGSADAVCLFFSLSLFFHNFFSISSTCLLRWCWNKILGKPEALKWFITIETRCSSVLKPLNILFFNFMIYSGRAEHLWGIWKWNEQACHCYQTSTANWNTARFLLFQHC